MPFYLQMSKNITQQRDIYNTVIFRFDSYKSSHSGQLSIATSKKSFSDEYHIYTLYIYIHTYIHI